MKQLVLALCLVTIGSLHAIENNVELVANKDFNDPALFANQASLAVTDSPAKWFAGNIAQFTTSIATGAFESSSATGGANIYDYFLGQITSETLNTGRYHLSIRAKGTTPFFLKLSGTNALGTEWSSVIKNAVGQIVASGIYSGYSIKFTPTADWSTMEADLDITVPTDAPARLYFIFPDAGNVSIDDVSFMRTKDIPVYTTYYVRTNGDNTSWTNLTGVDPDQIITSSSPAIVGTNTYYFANGTYTKSTTSGTVPVINLTTGKVYGGFSGNETTIDLSARSLSDKDGNGIIEPWEMTNETIITGTNPISGGVLSACRLVTVTGGEINGLTLQDHYYNASGPITLGYVSSAPTVAQDIEANAGKMINCKVQKLKVTATGGPVMTTNKLSLIDGCLIEECLATAGSSAGAVYMNLNGGIISNSVLRNNSSPYYAGAIRATAQSSSDMNAIVQNCAIYNNTSLATGGAVRSEGVAVKRGIQIVNCTFVNNKTATANTGTIDFISSGIIVNSIVVDDPREEIRLNSNNNYITNNAIGTLYENSVTAYPNTNMTTNKTAADFNFTSYSTYVGAMQHGDAGFNQTTYDAIRASNFSITSTTSAACTTTPLTTIPSSYLIGGTGASVALTATVPTTDITGLTRTGNYTLGAYQATHSVANGETQTISQPTTLASLTVAAGGKLTINNGISANIASLTLQSDATGNATMLNSGTFTGTVIAQQYLGSARNWYVSSPVTNAASPSNNVDYYYEYVEAGNNNPTGQPGSSTAYWKGLSNGSLMDIGKGYIAKTTAGTTVQFSGTPNNGNITTVFDLTRDDAKGKGFNLVGNPYPSYIDWSLVAAANPNLSSTFYFRSKNTNETSTYTFASYNGLLNEMVSSNVTPNTTITRFIPPTQAFWVRVNSGTSTTKMYFNNDMRAHRDDNGNLLKAPKADNRTRLRLQLISGSEADETMICTDANADNGFDMYDSPKMMNNSNVTPDLYTKADAERLVINGLNAITENVELPLGFSLNAAASLKLKATEISNFPTGTKIFLLDKVESVQTELLPETEYSFSTTAATTNNESRFSLIFRAPGTTTGVKSIEELNAQVFVNANNQITIIAPEKVTYSIYNTVGIRLENGVVNSKLETRNSKFGAGVYFVSLSVDGQRKIQKVIIR